MITSRNGNEFFTTVRCQLILMMVILVCFVMIPYSVNGRSINDEGSDLSENIGSRTFSIEKEGEIVVGGAFSKKEDVFSNCRIVNIESYEVVWYLNEEAKKELVEKGSFEMNIWLSAGEYTCHYAADFSDLFVWKMDKLDILKKPDEFTIIKKKLHTIEETFEDIEEDVDLKKQHVGDNLIEVLVRDRLLEREKDYKIKLTNQALYINGRKQDLTIHKKYRKWYEGQTGQEMAEKSEITITRRIH